MKPGPRLRWSTAPGASPPSRSAAAGAPLAFAPAIKTSATDIDALKDAIRLARRGEADAASNRRDQIHDVAGRKLAEWVILRSDDNATSFARYAAFVLANPPWPGHNTFRRRAEARLWAEQREPAAVLAFFSNKAPLSATGKLAMARALLARGDRAAARKYVRSGWRENDFPVGLETQALGCSSRC